MDIEPPTNIHRRKTDASSRNDCSSRHGDRRSMANKRQSEDEQSKHKAINYMMKGKQEKGKNTETNENNLNIPNRNMNENFPKIKSTQFNLGHNRNIEKEYDSLMKDIQRMKEEFINDHITLIREEGTMMKEESEMAEKIRRYNSIDPISYIEGVQRALNKKMEMFSLMKRKADYLAEKIYESEEMHRALGEIHINDEQLLEGLPAEEFGGRLF